MMELKDNIVGIGYKENLDPHFRYNQYDTADLLTKALSSAGLGRLDKNYPLKDIIKENSSILIKPNWVNHINYNLKYDLTCLISNHFLIESILDQLEGCSPREIIIADAPIQGCDFNKLLPISWENKLQNRYSFPIYILDLRQSIFKTNPNNKFSAYSIQNPNRSDNDFIEFDLGNLSSLEDISELSDKFRVTMYDHRELNKAHQKGKHQYLIAKESFEADVIINVPKLKTHKKAGMTGALKNLVGINGSKNYLPHHRLGGSKHGGDNYSGFSFSKRLSEFFIDQSNKNIGNNKYSIYKIMANVAVTLSNKIGKKSDFEGGWYGNDTVWRMVLDLNKILLYGNKDGHLSNYPLRKVFTITDAIIAGETEGPLNVEPVPLGIVTFSSSTAFSDLVNSYLMHFDWEKIPCIKEAFNLNEYQLVDLPVEACKVVVNGNEISLIELSKKLGKPFIPPKLWKGHIESNCIC